MSIEGTPAPNRMKSKAALDSRVRVALYAFEAAVESVYDLLPNSSDCLCWWLQPSLNSSATACSPDKPESKIAQEIPARVALLWCSREVWNGAQNLSVNFEDELHPFSELCLCLSVQPKEMLEFLVLINQLISTFKSGIKDLMQELFPYIVGHIFSTLPKETYPDGPESHTEEMQNLQELERVYFTFLQGITSNELSAILLTSKASHLLNDIIQTVLVASCQHKDVLVRKVCVQIFTCLVKEWCGTRVEEEKVPGFRGFIVETFAAKCCVYSVMEPSFNLRDANTFNLFGEIVAAQRVIYDHCGNDFLIHQATQVLPAVHCPPNMAEQYCFHIQVIS
ncbi:hypothetical protein L7F22_052200 [Adiantum nelumboides]|nr:hypothetical protein [Adiantum nelumboides]